MRKLIKLTAAPFVKHSRSVTLKMNSLVALICVVVAIASVRAAPAPEKLGDEGQWEAWKSVHEKKYKNGYVENYRKWIWQANLKKIEEHNKSGRFAFTMAMNQFGDLTPLEYRYLMLGTKYRHNNTERTGSTFLKPSNVELPTTVDWRNKGYVTPVKNQEQCGSCWAFSATGSLEGQHFKKTGKLVSLSEQNLVDCSTSFGNDGCNGGLMDNAFRYIKANGGIDTEASYPYTASDGNCKFEKANVGATCTGFTDIAPGSETDLQSAAATVGPISVAIDASHQSFQLYHGGVYDEPDCSSTQLDHGVLVVGYGTLGGKDYWLVKNSWGPTWGMNGYLMMSRNKNNQCGIATSSSYPLV